MHSSWKSHEFCKVIDFRNVIMSSRSIVLPNWQTSAEGETILQNFYDPLTAGRKLFGVLEKPSLPQHIEVLKPFKIFLSGKTAIGKTATIARLAGIKLTASYVETVGIRKTNIFWPVKIHDRIFLFKLQFWDAGENSTKKYGHILPACIAKADAVAFVFSFMDHSSFADLPQQMARTMKLAENPAPIAIGTKYNMSDSEVSAMEVLEFERRWKTPVLKIDNLCSGDSEVHEVAPLLNLICERLWLRMNGPPSRPSPLERRI